jgi:hypothetical protein
MTKTLHFAYGPTFFMIVYLPFKDLEKGRYIIKSCPPRTKSKIWNIMTLDSVVSIENLGLLVALLTLYAKIYPSSRAAFYSRLDVFR